MKKLLLFLLLSVSMICLTTSVAYANVSSNGPRVKITDSTSSNWSGYAAATSLASPAANSVSDVKGQWTVTPVTGGATNTYSSIWVGIDGYSDGTVEQIGIEEDWYNGAPRYYAWYEMYPKFPVTISSVPVAAGDSISAEVSYISNNKFALTITNLTSGKTYTTVQKTRAQRSSAEWIAEAPSSRKGVLPLTNFGTVSFTAAQATINGHTGPVNDPAWQYDPISMVSSTGSVKAAPSALSPAGSDFSVVWSSN
ncbi:MAG: G1 family glutamic endopeptidase [Thermoleophilia bacterium]